MGIFGLLARIEFLYEVIRSIGVIALYPASGSVLSGTYLHFLLRDAHAKHLFDSAVECNDPHMVLSPEGEANRSVLIDSILQQYLACGFAIVKPGLLPQLTGEMQDEMRSFVNAFIDVGTVEGKFASKDYAAAPHHGGRRDLMPPFSPTAPFGRKMLFVLLGLRDIITPLLGDSPTLSFISALHVPSGSPPQDWHSEGEAYPNMTSDLLKIQVLTHDVSSRGGMIRFLKHSARQEIHPSSPFPLDSIEETHWVIPPALPAGSIIFYQPFTLHAGGPNESNEHKIVLDIMFKGAPCPDNGRCGDDTPERFPAKGFQEHLRQRRAWSQIWARDKIARAKLRYDL